MLLYRDGRRNQISHFYDWYVQSRFMYTYTYVHTYLCRLSAVYWVSTQRWMAQQNIWSPWLTCSITTPKLYIHWNAHKDSLRYVCVKLSVCTCVFVPWVYIYTYTCIHTVDAHKDSLRYAYTYVCVKFSVCTCVSVPWVYAYTYTCSITTPKLCIYWNVHKDSLRYAYTYACV